MSVGELFLEALSSGVITQGEINWLLRQQRACSRAEQAAMQRLGRLLRPKQDGRKASFYTIIARDTVDQDFAQNRQRFLAEQGYSYEILDDDQI